MANTGSFHDSCRQQIIPGDFLRLDEQLTPTDLRRNVKNEEIVEIYSRTCTPIQRTLFGGDKKLQGPKGDLWIDPADRHVDGNGHRQGAKLTPVVNVEKVQALTHHGILRIGEKIEERIDVENSKFIEKTINETLEVAKFEADARIKFHTESVRQKLNSEWESRVEELKAKFEEEKQSLIEFYENEGAEGSSSRLMVNECQRFRVKDCGSSIDSSSVHGFNASAFARNEHKQMRKMMEVSSRGFLNDTSDEEPALQQLKSKTRHVNSKDKEDRMKKMKNECLNALELQRELMLCRHITEIVHLMAIVRQQDKTLELKNCDRHQAAENEKTLDHRHQSKSIINSSEAEMQQPKINNQCDEEKISEKRRHTNTKSIDYDGEGGESVDPKVNSNKLLSPSNSTATSISLSSRNDGSKWSTKSSKQSVIRNSFVDCVLNRFFSHHISSSLRTIEPFSSQQRENDYRKKSNPPPTSRTMVRAKAVLDPSTTDVDATLLPKGDEAVAAVSRGMKDSLEISSQSTTQRDIVR